MKRHADGSPLWAKPMNVQHYLACTIKIWEWPSGVARGLDKPNYSSAKTPDTTVV
jgi:hypothetical protein